MMIAKLELIEAPVSAAYSCCMLHTVDDAWLTYLCYLQSLAQADAIDAKAAAGEDVTPLCGLPLAVKDSTDVEGLPTSVGTTALIGAPLLLT